MTKSKKRSHRELGKPQQTPPIVQDLGCCAMPRKSNRAAAKYVDSVGDLWDRRRVDRKARKEALANQVRAATHPTVHRLSRRQKQWLLVRLSGWSLDASMGALQTPKAPVVEQLDQLVDVAPLPYVQSAVLKVCGMSHEEAQYVADRAPKTMRLVQVDRRARCQRVIRGARTA